MAQWFVSPIVVPGGMVAMIFVLVLYRHFVGACIKATSTRTLCLCSSRSQKVAQIP